MKRRDVLKKDPDPDLVTVVKDHTGGIGCLRFNERFPPFDNPAIRRLVLSAMNQRDYMDAVAGAEPSLIRDQVGLFVPGSPMASTAGIAEAMPGEKDPAKLHRGLKDAGYKGEKIVVLGADDLPGDAAGRRGGICPVLSGAARMRKTPGRGAGQRNPQRPRHAPTSGGRATPQRAIPRGNSRS